MQHIGLLGGTFDPIHNGHLHLANAVNDLLQLDEIRLIPCYQAVHRDQPTATPEQRLAMVRLACQGSATLRCDDAEYQRGGPSYMIDTLQTIKQLKPTAQLYLIIGYDSFIHFKTWKNWQGILELCNLIVAKRPHSDTNNHLCSPGEAKRNLGSPGLISPGCISLDPGYENLTPGKITILEINALDISSTVIRNRIKENKDVSDMLPNSVYQFIKQEGLYEN